MWEDVLTERRGGVFYKCRFLGFPHWIFVIRQVGGRGSGSQGRLTARRKSGIYAPQRYGWYVLMVHLN